MSRSTTFRDAVTIALLTFGVLIFAVGWVVGVALLWSSPTWRTRDKVLGTLVFPGGLPFAVVVAMFGLPVTVASRVPGLTFTLGLFVMIGPIYTAVHLTMRAFVPSRSAPASTLR